jgi:hypothetical protein
VVDVLRDATKLAINEQETLIPFNFLPELSIGDGESPSWVPRWDLQPDGRQHPGSFFFEEYSACGPHKKHSTTADTDNDPNILVMEGIAIDEISSVILSPEQETPAEVYIQALRDITSAMVHGDDMSSEDAEASVALTLIAEKNYRYKIISADAALDGFKAWKHYLYSTHTLPPRSRDVRNQIKDPSDEILRAAEYMQAFYNACRARSVFLTKRGRLGVGMKRIAPGDLVVVSWGCTLPVVLRSLRVSGEGEHAVVCVSYVSGVMHGESVEEQEAAGREVQRFLLR